MVETVFKNAIDSLSEDDRSLPQIEAILPVRGPSRPHTYINTLRVHSLGGGGKH
jgi:hypothetical protein